MARPKLTEAQKLSNQINRSKGGPSLELALDKLGKDSLESAKRSQATMQEAASKVLPELNSDSPLAKIIVEANEKTMALNPNNVTGKFLYKIPIPAVKNWMIKKYIGEFQSQEKQVMSIFESLDKGKDSLLMKMIDLQNQYETLEKTDAELDTDIATGKELLETLENVNYDELEQKDILKYQMATNKVSRRIRDLTTVKAAVQQFFVSIHQTMETQALLNESIDSIQTVGPLVLQNAIMINAAINEQKQVAEAAKSVQDSLANAMKQNAAMIKSNAEVTAEMYNNPVIAIEALQTSYDDLRSAVETTRKAMLESTANSKEMTAKLENMQAEFKDVEVSLKEGNSIQKQLTSEAK